MRIESVSMSVMWATFNTWITEQDSDENKNEVKGDFLQNDSRNIEVLLILMGWLMRLQAS